MKKYYFIFILLAIIIVFTTSCSSKENHKEPIIITLWHYYSNENQKILEHQVDEFNNTVGLEKNIIVEPISMDLISELEEELTNSANGVINSKPMPNIFSSYPDKAFELDSLDVIANLNDYFTEEDKNLYVANFLKDGITDDGRLLVLPIAKSTELLFINKTDLEKFLSNQNIDLDSVNFDTWEDVYSLSKKYYNYIDSKTPDIPWDGKGFIGFDSLANFIVISSKQMGIEIVDSSNKCINIDKTSLRKIFDIYYKASLLGYFDSIGKFRSEDVRSSDLIGYLGSTSGMVYFPTEVQQNNEKHNITMLAKLYPYFEKNEKCAIQQGAGMCIAKSTKEKEEASAIFLKWFTSTDNNIDFALSTGYLPVHNEAYNAEKKPIIEEKIKENDKMSQSFLYAYQIMFDQIIDSETYSPKPFNNSYYARIILENTLIDMVELDKQNVSSLKQDGKSEEKILEYINLDSKFEKWLDEISLELEKKEIPYKIL